MRQAKWVVALVLASAAVGWSQQEDIHQDKPSFTHNVEKADRGTVVVKEFLIDSDVEDIQWAGKTNKVVFVRSVLGSVYRSADDGKTWQFQMTNLRGSMQEDLDNNRGVAEVVVSEADRDYIFLQGNGETHWITRDGGESYEMLAGSFPIKQVQLHKTNPEWVLASRWSAGCKNTAVSQNCSIEVHLSLDFGRSWSFLESYVAQFGWGRAHRPEEIFMVRFERGQGNQRFGAWDKEADFFRSDDLWKSNIKLIPHGNRFLLMDRYVFVAMVNPEKDNEVQLVVGKDDQLVYEVGRLPFELREHSYTILDASGGAVFLHVNHGDFNTPMGTIYLSDADGWRYTLSLRNNRRDVRGRCDFEKVQGLDGIFIANAVQNPDQVGTFSERERVGTVMTFDNGAKWGKIPAPAYDAEGKDTQCSVASGCSLHLHGVTDEWGPFYSTKSALGLIMATGNLGGFLEMTHGGSVNTYFSRDAGQSWSEVRKGSHIYEFGDHGALIVMAKDREPTNEVLYTWNEGISWKTLALPALTDVDNIITEPNSTAPSFVLYGSRNGVGVLMHLDFSTLHVKQCEGVDAAGKPQSSYELWSPSDGLSKCLLGRHTHYTRRKRQEECFNGEKYERQMLARNCPCTEANYECDYGFERQGLDGPCVNIKAVPTTAPENCPAGGEYTIPNGYRRVAGDSCDADKGVNRLPPVFACPSAFLSVSGGGGLVLGVLLVVAAVLGAAWYVNKNPEVWEDFKLAMGSRSHGYHRVGDMAAEALIQEEDDDFGIDESDAKADLDNLELGDDEPSAFGPLPTPAFEDAEVPALQPPPDQGQGGEGDAFSSLAAQEDALFRG